MSAGAYSPGCDCAGPWAAAAPEHRIATIEAAEISRPGARMGCPPPSRVFRGAFYDPTCRVADRTVLECHIFDGKGCTRMPQGSELHGNPGILDWHTT